MILLYLNNFKFNYKYVLIVLCVIVENLNLGELVLDNMICYKKTKRH